MNENSAVVLEHEKHTASVDEEQLPRNTVLCRYSCIEFCGGTCVKDQGHSGMHECSNGHAWYG